MTNDGIDPILASAMGRGNEILNGISSVEDIAHLATYTGLLQKLVELGKLVATESRDIHSISSHYAHERAKLEAAFAIKEAELIADFSRDADLRARTMLIVEKLVEQGQFDVALKFYERMLADFSGKFDSGEKNHLSSSYLRVIPSV